MTFKVSTTNVKTRNRWTFLVLSGQIRCSRIPRRINWLMNSSAETDDEKSDLQYYFFVIQTFQKLTWNIYLNLVKIILTLCHTDVRKRVFASSWFQGNCHAGLRFISLEVGWLIEASVSERPATASGDVRPSQSNPTSRDSFCPSTSIVIKSFLEQRDNSVGRSIEHLLHF